MKYLDLSGTWKCEIPGMEAKIHLPGTLDENGIGFPDDPAKQWKAEEVQRIGFWQPGDPIVTRLTRKYTFEGCARISRTVEWKPTAGMRAFVDVERARQLRLLINGKEAPLYRPGCLSASWCFEVTAIRDGPGRPSSTDPRLRMRRRPTGTGCWAGSGCGRRTRFSFPTCGSIRGGMSCG